MTQSQRNYKRRFRNFLLNRRFQLRWTAAIIVLTGALLGSLGGYIYWYEKQTSAQIFDGLDKLYEPEEVAILAEMFERSDSTVGWVLLSAGGALILALAGIGIVLTHKVAGPMYSLVRSFERIRRGDWRSVRGFRKGDEFQEVGAQFRELMDTLVEKETGEVAVLEKVRAMPDMPDAAVEALARLIAEKRALVQ